MYKIKLDALPGTYTRECFTDSRWKVRHGAYDGWLGPVQPAADSCTVTVVPLTGGATFSETFFNLLGTDASATPARLIGGGHCLTLLQAESLVEKTERGEHTGLYTDCHRNFFPVATGNPDEPVAIGDLSAVGREWHAVLNKLSWKTLWIGHSTMLLSNFSPIKVNP